MILGEKSERRDQSFFSFLENFHLWKSLPRAPEFEYPPLPVLSGGYSNLRARGKNFQKLMLFEKKKDMILACIFFSKTHDVL